MTGETTEAITEVMMAEEAIFKGLWNLVRGAEGLWK